MALIQTCPNAQRDEYWIHERLIISLEPLGDLRHPIKVSVCTIPERRLVMIATDPPSADDLGRGEVPLPDWTEIILFNDGKGSKGETYRR